jgi:hypothetical protein
MAKKKIRKKRRIYRPVLFISSRHLTIQSLQLPILSEMLSLGLAQVFKALRDHGRAPHLRLSLQQKMRQKRQ